MTCYWTHEHGPHQWAPLVADPSHERVLHVGLAMLACPGVTDPTPERPSQDEFDELSSALAEIFHDVGLPISLGLRDQVAGRLIESSWYDAYRSTLAAAEALAEEEETTETTTVAAPE